jgi:hypothetical protein
MTGGFVVTRHVPRDFTPPILPVVLRDSTVFPASVPKTSIHKYYEPGSAKNKIWFAKKLLISAPASNFTCLKNRN